MEEIDVKEFVKNYYKERKINIIIIFASLIIGIIYSFFIKEPLYRISSEIVINKDNISIEAFLRKSEIIKQVSLEVNINEEIIDNNLYTEFDKSKKVIKLVFVNENCKVVYDVINKYQNILKEKLEESFSISQFEVLNDIKVPDHYYNVNHFLDIIISIFIGILITIIYTCLRITMLGVISLKPLEKTNIKMTINKKTFDRSIKNIITTMELNNKIDNHIILLLGINNKVSNNKKLILNLACEYKKNNKSVLIVNTNNERYINEKNKKYYDIEEVNIDDSKVDSLNKEAKINLLEFNYNNMEINLNTTLMEIQELFNRFSDKYNIILIDDNDLFSNDLTLLLVKFAKLKILNINYGKASLKQVSETIRLVDNLSEIIDIGIINNDYF